MPMELRLPRGLILENQLADLDLLESATLIGLLKGTLAL